ncbi:MAG TPA: type II toxin-antitoxin system antitoxin SocA domain-containing protein [Pseudonocardiaceae bacterium]
MADVDDVAAAILARTSTVTTIKLQKLIYYSQAWHLVRTGEALFEDRIEAWPQGPVILSIYKKHRRKYKVSDWPTGRAQRLDPSERSTLDWVLEKYSHFSAESLSRITHLELPWKTARQELSTSEKSSAEIPVQHMRHYYARQLADVESAVSHAAASSSLEGIDLDEEWQDVLRSVADGSMSAAAAVQQEINRAKHR